MGTKYDPYNWYGMVDDNFQGNVVIKEINTDR